MYSSIEKEFKIYNEEVKDYDDLLYEYKNSIKKYLEKSDDETFDLKYIKENYIKYLTLVNYKTFDNSKTKFINTLIFNLKTLKIITNEQLKNCYEKLISDDHIYNILNCFTLKQLELFKN